MGLSGRCLITAVLACCAAQAEATVSLTVLVYDYAQVPDGMLSLAESYATRSYAAAGIKITWLACAKLQEDTEQFRACDRASAAGSPYVKLIGESMAARDPSLKSMEDGLGMAAGRGAMIVYPRIHQVAQGWNWPEEAVVGRVIAHELGHVLLGDNSHAAHGVMRPHFGFKDLDGASAQHLFEPEQAARLRTLIGKR